MDTIETIRANQASLISLVPAGIRNCIEIKGFLNAVDAELDRLYAILQQVLDNQFIDTADADIGIKRFERENGIAPRDDESLEDRRDILLSHTIEHRPYTKLSLDHILSLIVHGHCYDFEIDPENLTFALTLYGSAREYRANVEKVLDRILPINLTWSITEVEYNNMSKYTYDGLTRFTYDELAEFTHA